MEIQTNHNLRLLNAKCEYVCIVDNLFKKLDYGDDIECCLNKLYLASKLINRLECYNFTLITNILNKNSEFYTDLDETQANRLSQLFASVIELNVDGVTYTLVSTGTINNFGLIVNKLNELGILVFFNISAESMRLYLTCNILNIGFTIKYGETPTVDYILTNTVPGVCASSTATTFENCIEQSDLREMYAVLDNLLS